MTDFTVAASERAVGELFNLLKDEFFVSESVSKDFGSFSASASFACHLENGTIDLRADNTVRVAELDIVCDTLSVSLGIDLPELSVGGWCIVPTPWGCAVRLPELSVFEGSPDIIVPLDLAALLRIEVSFIAALRTAYRVDPARQPWMTYLDAEDAGVPNKWQLFIDPESVDIDLFDVSDIVGDILEAAADAAIDDALWFLPGWARSLVKEMLGPVIDLIRTILDISDDVDEWLGDLLGTSLGLLDIAATAVLDYFATTNPILWFEDPYPVLNASGGLIPVKVPLVDLSVYVTADELVVEANVGL